MADQLVDAEASAYQALEKEYGDAPAAPVAAEPAPDAAPAEPDKAEKPVEEAKPAAIPYEELEKRYKNLNGALAEERANARAYRERLGQFEQVVAAIKAKNEAPPQQEEYVDPIEREIAELKRQNQELTAWKQQTAAEREESARRDSVSRNVTYHEQQFAKENPDYFDAVTHLVQSRSAELAIMMPDDDPNIIHMARKAGFNHPSLWREEMIRQEAMRLGEQALSSGQNPANVYYTLAKHRGYAPKAPAAPAAPAEAQKPQRIEAIRKGSEAPGSLSTGATKSAANAEGFPSLEELAEMYVSDPKKAESTFSKMQKAGLLG